MPGLNGLLGLAVGVVVIAALYFAREVLVPIMLAVLLSFVLAPGGRAAPPGAPAARARGGDDGAVRARARRVARRLIGTQIASLTGDVPRYAASVEAKVAGLRASTIGSLPRLIDKVGRQFDRASGGQPAVLRRAAVGSAARPMQVEVQPAPATPLGLARSVLGPVVGPLETTLIVVIVAIFILLQREDLRDRMIRLLGSTDLHRTTTAMDDAAARLGRYFLSQLAINAVFGMVIAVGLALIGVPLPLLWGVLAGLLRFLPYIRRVPVGDAAADPRGCGRRGLDAGDRDSVCCSSSPSR
ncbi:AI-2E family transporter [Sphingomonas sp.]|uniref:AI-2E family transporter n=1 Tax=Sphingomonas sp. TaxID=28214 RepID=UPI003CC64CE5